MADEDFFSDNDLDDITDDTLQELEQYAIASTQRPKSADQPTHYGPKTAKHVSNVKSNLPWRPSQPRFLPVQPPRSAPPASAPAPPSSDYGLDEEDVIDLDEPSMVIQPASGPHIGGNAQLRSAVARKPLHGSKAVLDPETEAAFAAADAELGAQSYGQWHHASHLQPQASNGMDLSALQTRVAELEAEQARLRKAEEAAHNAAAVKQGEIAIVRSNQEKAAKEYERRIAVMQKLHADEAARVKAEIEAGKKDREKLETDNRFLQHDLAQEAERMKRANGPGKARALGIGREKETPRKARRTGLGDGFDDGEVGTVSPSRSREKTKESTPKHGTKRRRTANDSPVAALSFTQPPEPVREEGIERPAASAEQPRVSAPAADERFEFMQRLLNHSPNEGHQRTIEALTKHAMVSEANQSLASALLDQLAYPVASSDIDYLPLKLSRALLGLWSRCLDDKNYSPLYLLVDLVRFALYSELASVKSQLIEEAVPICVRTVDLIAAPTMRASTNPTYAASLDRAAQDRLADELCAAEVMDLLLYLCQAATLTGDLIEVFWKHMDFRFTLLMLNRAQPVHQINTMLRALATFALPTIFGPIADDAEAQSMQEVAIIDRLTSLLFEMPEPPSDEPPYTESETAELRLEILRVVKAMCLTDHGGLLLAQHRSAIGRMIRFLDGQINKLYILPPAPLPTPSEDKEEVNLDAHTLVAQTINLTTRLFYHILRTHDESIDLTQKLNVIHGGYQKFLICMSRLAFSEQLVLEHGIEDEVTEAAHSILDNHLSPEEGEAIVAAVETPWGSKGSEISRGETTEKDTSRDETQVDGDTTMNDPG